MSYWLLSREETFCFRGFPYFAMHKEDSVGAIVKYLWQLERYNGLTIQHLKMPFMVLGAWLA